MGQVDFRTSAGEVQRIKPKIFSSKEHDEAKSIAQAGTRKARMLVLHGYAQSGVMFEAKTRFLIPLFDHAFRSAQQPAPAHAFPDGFEFVYATAQHRVEPATMTGSSPTTADLDAWTWRFGDYANDEIQGYEESIRYLLQLLQTEGPFVGVVGFSTGATAALTLVSLADRGATPEIMKDFKLHPGLLPPPFRFAIFCCGCILSHPRYRTLYYPKICTLALHFVGQLDTFIPEIETSKFSRRCRNCVTVHHPGAHFVPRYKISQESMLDFLIEQVEQF